MYIGLSVSACIRDIAKGRIPESQVAYIIGGTQHEGDDAFMEACVRYAQGDWLWHDCRWEAVGVAARLWSEGRILQPRTQDGPILSIARGPWLRVEQGFGFPENPDIDSEPEWYEGFAPHRKYED